MSTPTIESAGSRLNLTATQTIKGAGRVLGVFVASSTAGTLKFADAAGTIVNTFSATAATYYKLPFSFAGDLTITVGGTIDCTVGYEV